jgi:hypothetical protein
MKGEKKYRKNPLKKNQKPGVIRSMKTMDDEFKRMANIMARFGASVSYPHTLVDYSRLDPMSRPKPKNSDHNNTICMNTLTFGFRPVFWIKPDGRDSEAKALTAGGYLVHVLIAGHQHTQSKSVTVSHGEGTAWDYICIHSAGGGLDPARHPRRAMFVKDQEKGEKKYTFRGVYEADIANSDEFKITYRRIADEVDEEDEDWRIVKIV